MTDELFQEQPEDKTGEALAPTLTMHEQLVGEGKKYSDNEKLAQSVDHKERFIQQLQSENQGLRGELSTRVSLEEFMENQEKTRQVPTPTPGAEDSMLPPTGHVSEPTGHTSDTTNSAGTTNVTDLVSQETERLLEQKLTERDTVLTEQANLSFVKSEATKALGTEYPYLFSQKAKELGMDQEYLNRMAQSQPKVFLSLMLGQDYQKAQSVAPPVSSVNPAAQQAFSNAGQPKKKLSDWNDMLKTDPTEYWSVPVQNQIHDAAKAAADRGESFIE